MSWNNFTREEFACKCGCETNEIKDETIDFAQELRDSCGFALSVSSGYRCLNHPVEAKKSKPGTHPKGLAVDFAVSHAKARTLISKAVANPKLKGLGINQKGAGRFIHVDIGPGRENLVWTY